MVYQVTGNGGPLWIAWGPPYTPKDTEKLIEQMEKALPSAKGFELSQTREKRPVRGVWINGSAPRVRQVGLCLCVMQRVSNGLSQPAA